jgi:hypothetical protein
MHFLSKHLLASLRRRTLLGGLVAAGLASETTAEEPAAMIDPRTIRFSMATISNDAAPVEQIARPPTDTELVFHEDEWRQLEFFPFSRAHEIQQRLIELKAFEAAHRTQYGWTQIYVRDLPPESVLSGNDPVRSLADQLHAEIEAAPILVSGTNSIVGRVRGGFSLRIGDGAALYGFQGQSSILVLGAHLQNADDQLLTRAFTALSGTHQLILVDWRAQMLLLSVGQDGQIIVWSP